MCAARERGAQRGYGRLGAMHVTSSVEMCWQYELRPCDAQTRGGRQLWANLVCY